MNKYAKGFVNQIMYTFVSKKINFRLPGKSNLIINLNANCFRNENLSLGLVRSDKVSVRNLSHDNLLKHLGGKNSSLLKFNSLKNKPFF